MTQAAIQPKAPADDKPGFARPASFNEFDYKPVPILAPVALFLGIASFSGLMGVFGLGIAIVGLMVGAICLVVIGRSTVPLSGKPLAIAGMVLSAAFLSCGIYFQIEDYKAELPPGYERVNFPREIAEKKFVIENGTRAIHPDVKPLVDQKLYLKGYIWQTKTSTGLRDFVLLKDNGECCFGGDPAPNDMIAIRLPEGKTFDADPNIGLIGVAGVLEANPHAGPDEPVYTMEARHVAKAKTAW